MNFYSAYSVQPRPSTLPERAKPKPTMSFAEYAEAENLKAGLSAKPRLAVQPINGKDPESLYCRVFCAVRDHGPIFAEDVVRIVGVKPAQVYNTINKAKSHAIREGYDWHVEDVYFKGNKTKRRYWLEARG